MYMHFRGIFARKKSACLAFRARALHVVTRQFECANTEYITRSLGDDGRSPVVTAKPAVQHIERIISAIHNGACYANRGGLREPFAIFHNL